MSEDVQIIPLSDHERWRAETVHDGRPSQDRSYLEAISRPGAEPRLAVVRSGGARLLLPFIERDWHGDVDIATPLGLSGASVLPSATAPFELWREYASGQGWIAGYIQLAPDVDIESPPAGDRLVAGNEVFLLDLSMADPLASASEIVRRKIRRGDRAGVGLVTDPDRLGDALARLYPPTMARLGAGEAYGHGDAGLRALARIPGAVVVGAERDDEVLAVSVFIVAGQRAEYLCNASSEQGRELAAWLIAQGISRLQRAGVTELNLGGGVRRDDGLHQFKARFNGRACPLRSLRQVYDHGRYLALCAAAAADPDGSWFPAYRRPPSSPA